MAVVLIHGESSLMRCTHSTIRTYSHHAGSLQRCSLPPARKLQRTPPLVLTRQFSHKTAAPTASLGSPSQLSAVDKASPLLGAQLAHTHHLPLFRVPSEHVSLLENPEDFYTELLGIIARARRRVFLASLYIGKTEHDLIHHLAKSLNAHEDLQVTILVDGLRSTREGAYQGTSSSASCASLLAALQARFPSRVEVRAYRAPDLPTWLERMVGKRFVEGWGLQHMKIYGGDDEVMISGANLSNDYFTNRRDRYLTIRDAHVSQYMHDVLMTASRYSYSLQAIKDNDNDSEASMSSEHHTSYKLEWDEGKRLRSHAVRRDDATGPITWKQPMQDDVESLTSSWYARSLEKEKEQRQQTDNGSNTVDIVPMLQMGPMRIRHETSVVPMVLDAANKLGRACRLDFTTGYFSLNPQYAESIVTGQFRSSMITAAPSANGFFGSNGVSRHLPAAYTWLEHRFWRTLKASKRTDDVTIREWSKAGWTYHAKGLWLYPRHDADPRLTLLGSSNFGIRSAKLDLECTLVVDATRSPALQVRLGEEIATLHRDANDVVGAEMFERAERKVHWGVKVAAWCIRRML